MSSISAGTTTTTGYVVSSDTTGSLVLKTGASATTAVTVDTSQNVGIATTTPTAKFVVGSGNTLLGHNTLDNYGGNVDIRSAYQVRAANTPTQLFVADSAGSQTIDTGGAIDLGGYTSSLSRAYTHARIQGLANAGSGYGGYLSLMVTNAGGAVVERARIPTTGGIQSVNSISVGNVAPTTSGAGITFPATQSASSDANTLDDYEEGTWTPASSFTGGNGTRTDTVTGKYTKIGDMVYANFDIAITKGTASGNLSVTGLPFARGGQDNRGGGVMFTYINMTTLTNGLIAYIGDNQSSFTFFNGPNLANITPAGNLGTVSQFIGTVIYKV